MFSEKDLNFIHERGISQQQIEQQILQFKNGFPPMKIVKPAVIRDGIKQLNEKQILDYIKIYNKASRRIKRLKFVPSSGAATRMFKSLYKVMNEYTGSEADYLEVLSDKSFNSLYYMLQNLNNFAFFDDLINVIESNSANYNEIKKKHDYPFLLKCLLEKEGLNYGNLPKGLLKFHKTFSGERTPVHEHLIEGIKYAASGKNIYLHFTVSPQHIELFQKHVNAIAPLIQKENRVKFVITYSIQKPSTDTIAVDEKNNPIRDENGNLIFRPGGHGALIINLNEIDADIVFVKNVDNVVQERLLEDTIIYKKALAGMLINLKETAARYFKKLGKKPDEKLVIEVEEFLRKKLMHIPPDVFFDWDLKTQVDFLKQKLNRPFRVCGMVKNEGEPGGGPYWVKENDGSMGLQIVEAVQFTDQQKVLMQKATHFNPVDIVCSITNFRDKKYDLLNFVDNSTGFISVKSINGDTIKALELPGLWNGAMANWNSIFVEVPASTFNPVKTVNDLLRTEHLFEKDLLHINNANSIVIE